MSDGVQEGKLPPRRKKKVTVLLEMFFGDNEAVFELKVTGVEAHLGVMVRI